MASIRSCPLDFATDKTEYYLDVSNLVKGVDKIKILANGIGEKTAIIETTETSLSQQDLEWITKLQPASIDVVISNNKSIVIKNSILTISDNLKFKAASIDISDSSISGFDAATGTAKNITFSAETIKLTNSEIITRNADSTKLDANITIDAKDTFSAAGFFGVENTTAGLGGFYNVDTFNATVDIVNTRLDAGDTGNVIINALGQQKNELVKDYAGTLATKT